MELNGIYRAEDIKIFEYGLLIKTNDKLRKTGLVHISKIKNEKIENLSEIYRVNDSVFAKCIEMREDGRLSFAIKSVNQKTGKEEILENSEFQGKKGRVSSQMDAATLKEYENYLMSQEFGPLTGIKLDFQTTKSTQKRNPNSEIDLWERTRLNYNRKNIIDEPEEDQISADMNEEELDIVLNENEPEFLKGKTNKKGAHRT